MEAVILAGGQGTRLRSVIRNLPKPMAPVNGAPFLQYVLDLLITSKVVSKFILCVGYKNDLIRSYFGNTYKSLPIIYSIEEEPLGTGGAVVQALPFISEDNFVLFNGDTLFTVNLVKLMQEHRKSNADISIAAKSILNSSRYGTIQKVGLRIVKFEEKKYCNSGEINGGVYVFKKQIFTTLHLAKKFSLEKDLLEKHVSFLNLQAITFDEYFVDIGTPDDYQKAQIEFQERFPINSTSHKTEHFNA